MSQSDDYHLGSYQMDQICSKLGSEDPTLAQPLPCSNGFYQCFTPIYCNVGAIKHGDICTFAQEFSHTEYDIGIDDYCNLLGYHLPSLSTSDSMIPESLMQKLVKDEIWSSNLIFRHKTLSCLIFRNYMGGI